MKKHILYIFLCGWLAVSVNSCSSFFDIELEGVVLAEDALQTPEDLELLLNSCYDVVRSGKFLGGRYQTLAELMADNMDGRVLEGNFLSYFNKNTTIFNGETRDIWSEAYLIVYRANVLVENVDIVPGVTEDQRTRIIAEANFLKGIAYFELVRMFAQPYGFTADNSHPGIVLRAQTGIEKLGRSTVGETYTEIITLMQAAENVLPEDNGGYATSWAVKGYLAKVYFQQNDFANAFTYANDIVTNGPFTLNPDVMARYSQTANTENIFTLASTGTFDHSGGTFQGNFRSDGAQIPAGRLNSNIYGLATADSADLRGQNWYSVLNAGQPDELILCTRFDGIDWFSVPIVHLAEIMLIRAESAAEQSDLATAEADLNAVRARAGLDPITGLGQADLIQAIRDERRLEMVVEGNRLHDLRRQGANGENITINGSPWDCNGFAIQLPDIEKNGNPDIELNPEGGCN